MNKEKTFNWIPVEVNHYKGVSTYIHKVVFDTVEQCQSYFDERHKERSGEDWGTNRCDYSRSKWEIEYDNLRKYVDHDGAGVEYICMKLTKS